MTNVGDQNPIDLTGQVAIVTGGGRGLGRAYAQALAAHGAAVAVVARSVEQIAETAAVISAAGGQVLTYALDITDAKAVLQMTAEVERLLGPVGLLVNNAAVVDPIGPFWESDIDEWWRAMDVNVRGVLLCTRAILPGMLSRGRGRIINIASAAGTGVIPYVSAYVTSKAALIRLTEVLAAETREHGIHLFAINPGSVRTPMAESIIDSPAGEKWVGWFGKVFEEGQDDSPDASMQLVLRLAAGHADVLSGCYISISHDLDNMISHAADISAGKLYSLRIKTVE